MNVPAPTKVSAAILVALAAAILAVANDFTALGIVIPTLEKQFSTDLSTAQWAVNGYSLAFALVVVPAGRFTDLFGAVKVFTIGAVFFAAMSIVVAVAPAMWILIGGRALQGLGGGFMWTSAVAIAFAKFGSARAGTAGAFILGVAGVGNALGPVDAGILTDAVGWEWVLLVNVPLCAFAILAIRSKVRLPRVEQADRTIDWGGIGLLAGALVAILLTLDYVPSWGWSDSRTLIGLALGVLLLVAFVVLQRRRGEAALMPPDIVRSRPFVVSCACVGLLAGGFFAALIYAPQISVKILGADPEKAGLELLPMMGAFAATAYFGGKLYNRLGPRIVVASGGALMVTGVLLLALIPDRPSYGNLVPGFVLLGIGTGLTFPASTAAGISALSEARRGLASGVIYMVQVAGGAIGIAATTSVVTQVSDERLSRAASIGRLPVDERLDLQGVLVGTDTAQQVVAKLGDDTGAHIVKLAQNAFIGAVQSGLWVDVVLGAVGVVVAVLGYRASDRPGPEARG